MVYFISNEGKKGFFIPGGKGRDWGQDRNGFRNTLPVDKPYRHLCLILEVHQYTILEVLWSTPEKTGVLPHIRHKSHLISVPELLAV